MSSAGAGAAVVGLISGVISIIEATKTIYDAAKDVKGQPETFRQVHARLVLVIEILNRARERALIVDKTTQEALEPILESCKAKAKNLQKIFQKVIRKDDDRWYNRYKKALSTLGKEYKVECLMEEILKDIQVLVYERLMGTATNAQLKDIQEAIKEMNEMPSSLRDETRGGTQNYQGSSNNNANTSRGAQHNGTGDLYHNEIKGDAHFGSNSTNPTFNICAPPERLETPPNPLAIIPFSRDPDFVKRGVIFDQIDQKCAVLGSRTALVGLGGVGKSQLAIEYAYRTQERSPKTWVFWVHASNAARFEQSFRDIANCVKIFGRQNPEANIFQLVHDWLRDDRKGKWVLILDNVDDAGFLVKDQSTLQDGQTNGIDSGSLQPLVSYLPHCPNGSILITTRSRNTALKLVEQRDTIVVGPMSKGDALSLFENKLGGHTSCDDTAELAAELEFMPLAIVQAATYVYQRAPRYSVQEYLQEFRKSDRKRTSLLNYEGAQLRRDWEAKNSIMTTWQISFNHIREIRPSASDLLSLMSFFDRQGIPEALLQSRSEQRNSRQDQKGFRVRFGRFVHGGASYSNDNVDGTSQSSLSNGFEDDVLTLRNYSFISINLDGTTFEMHSLVQLATRKWLEDHGQQERWKRQFIRNLNADFPTGEYENWVSCQALFPHAQSAAAQQPGDQDSLIDWTSILYKAAWYAWRIGNGIEAEKMSLQAAKIRKRVLGQEHNDTLDSMVMVALAYDLRGRWDAAAEIEVQVVETRKRILGADHHDTLTIMGNLAATYRNQKRWDEAEELAVQVMETRKKKFGADDPDTLISMGIAASTLWDQGRWDAAEELETQVMEARKRILGADHPATLSSISSLASMLWNRCQWDEAEELHLQVMKARKKKLGADHPDTLTSMDYLAHTWKCQNCDAEALGLISICVSMSARKLGAGHPDTLERTQIYNSWKMEGSHIS